MSVSQRQLATPALAPQLAPRDNDSRRTPEPHRSWMRLAFPDGIPGGLNGEGHMREWMKDRVTRDVYDLNTEREQFRLKTHSLLEEAGITLRLL